ncbi:ATP-dependent DNA helicase [Trichonephila clavipes]|nr:ATP-dependent DNA helicase [Trichonephila clavipes]
MTSFGADNIVSMQGFCPTFTIQGQIYHTIGSLLPTTEISQPKFLQVYFMGDKEAQVNRRSEYVQGVERSMVKKIQVLHDHNILVHAFKMAKDRVTSDNYKVVIHPDRVPRGECERRFNAPTTNEIAAVVVIVNELRVGTSLFKRTMAGLPEFQILIDFMMLLCVCVCEYPIIFWKGQEGYSFDIPQINPFTKQPTPNKKVSCKDFYAYHMMVRRNNFNLLLRCGLPFHQFLVGMYVKVESKRLRFIALNQTKLRAENYINLQGVIRNDADLDPNNLGQKGETQRGLHSSAQRVNPEFRVGSNFRIIPEQYFSGVENVAEFLENIDNNLTYYEIPTQLACAYLKVHLTGRALNWFEVLGYRVVEDKVTDYAHLKQALTEQFPWNRQENWRETRGNNRYSGNCRPRGEFNRFEGQGVADNRRFDGRHRGGQSDIIDSTIKVVDKVVRGTVLSGVRMIKTDI